jgi:DNA-binding response OmpR family regulator
MKVDLNQNKVIVDDSEVDLTKLEAALLKIMITNKGKVLDREFLLKHIWKDTQNIHQKTVNVAMKRLKEKIDPTKEKDYVKTIRGVGYLLS